jgi:two-component system, probable response regulator PhcQ
MPERGSEAGADEVVLFVDDEPALLEGVKTNLRKEPYQIVTCTSGSAALELLATQRVDVIVSDERMPGMSGSELLAQVRKRYPSMMRVMLTGQASLEATIRAINEGEVYRFLTKPCTPVQLAQTIRDALLIKRLMSASSRLLDATRRQGRIMDALEDENPGITEVAYADDGRIAVEEMSEEDPRTLIEQMRREAESADARIAKSRK